MEIWRVEGAERSRIRVEGTTRAKAQRQDPAWQVRGSESGLLWVRET